MMKWGWRTLQAAARDRELALYKVPEERVLHICGLPLSFAFVLRLF